MSVKAFFISLLVFIAVIIGGSSVFIVSETERGVILWLGKVSNADIPPGLHFKVPLAHEVRKFDARVLTLDARPERFLTSEKKSIMVDSFAKWRIVDVSKYYTATNGEVSLAERSLAQRINEGLRNQFATRSLKEVVSEKREELMEELSTLLDGITRESLGIEIVDVRVKRIDLPAEVSGPVYSRMAAEREKEAREHRSKGKEEAEKIRADADRQRTILTAHAYRESELLRGEGDAKAAGIYASAYNKDPEFYAFVRSLNAYRHTFSGKQDILLVDPDSDFFRYLNNVEGK